MNAHGFTVYSINGFSCCAGHLTGNCKTENVGGACDTGACGQNRFALIIECHMQTCIIVCGLIPVLDGGSIIAIILADQRQSGGRRGNRLGRF